MDRIECLKNRKEINDEEIFEILKIKHEYADMKLLKTYTNKNFKDLSILEKQNLIHSLIYDEEYIKYKNCYIAKSKLLYDTKETLQKEIAVVSKLNDFGYTVYLLPYGYARNKMNCFQKSADSILEGDFLEIKTVISTGKSAGESAYKDARLQANNVFLSIVNETSEKKIINNIYRFIGQIKNITKNKKSENDFSGNLFIDFEKLQKVFIYTISKTGDVSKRKAFNYANNKKSRELVYTSSQVVENPITKYGSSLIEAEVTNKSIEQPLQNIVQENLSVNQKNEEYKKLLYSQTEIKVNGVMRTCKNGLLKGFENAVLKVDELKAQNTKLKSENKILKNTVNYLVTEKTKEIKNQNKIIPDNLEDNSFFMGM